MSFILAKKYKDQIRVFADNKMSIEPNDELSLIKYIGEESYKNIKSLGVIKNVIINNDLCVCSAGILEDYNKLLAYIDDTNPSFDDICDKALQINIESNNQTDFIVCSVNSNSILIEVKDYKKQEVDSSWIGSKACFEKFQSFHLSDDVSNLQLYSCENNIENQLYAGSKDSWYFSETLRANVDNSVGNVVIECSSSDHKFYYNELITSISQLRVVSPNGQLSIYDNASDGGYTCQVFESTDNYKMYIYQLNCGIEYCPCIDDSKYNHLRLPKLDHCSIDEFRKKHNY